MQICWVHVVTAVQDDIDASILKRVKCSLFEIARTSMIKNQVQRECKHENIQLQIELKTVLFF